MDHPGSSDLDDPNIAAMLAESATTLAAFLSERESAPASTPADPDTLAKLRTPPPEQATDLRVLLQDLHEAATAAVDTAGPRYLGYIPGGGLPSSAVGELLARVFNRHAVFADIAPGLVTVEDAVLRWMTTLFGLPSTANGLLTTGGSQAMLTMVFAAREHHFPDGQFGRGRLYLSEQAHNCVRKAARITGFRPDNIRLVPTTDGRRLDPDAAAQAITADRAAGYHPFLLIGSAGTTNTGVIDPLHQLADLAAHENLWLHVDGCYGGFFQLTERGRELLRGIERADSLSLDPHKSLFLPYGTGALLVRDAATLTAAHDETGSDYLQDIDDGDLPDFARRGGELSRESRGPRVWLPLHLHGIAAFRTALDEKLDLARHAYAELAATGLFLLEPPELSTIAFRLPEGDAATRELLRRINEAGRVFCSSTRLDGSYTVRMCVLSHRTHLSEVNEAVATILRAAREVRAQQR